ncbi:MAG: hypothetical protein HY558_04930 [Euryarchaeota archaeon]|nr:hypothetical protein [Euryarchaeota archaeon]
MSEVFLGVFPIGKELAIQEVMEAAGRSYKPTYFALMRLVERGYLLRRRRGWKHLFRLNVANPFVRKMVEIKELERLEALALQLGEHGHAMVEMLLDRVTEKVPVLAAVTMEPLRVETTPEGKEVKHLSVLFVVPHQNGYGDDIRQACEAVSRLNGLRIKSAVASRDVYRRIVGNGTAPRLKEALNQGVPLLGQEFILRERLRALQPPTAPLNPIGNGHNGNGHNGNGHSNSNGNGHNGNGHNGNGHTSGNGNGYSGPADHRGNGRGIGALNVTLANPYPISPLGIRHRR